MDERLSCKEELTIKTYAADWREEVEVKARWASIVVETIISYAAAEGGGDAGGAVALAAAAAGPLR